MTTAPALHRAMTHDSLALFLQEIIVEYDSYKDNIRRLDARESVSIPVEARRLDAEGVPVGPVFHLVTRDISCGGLGMFNRESIDSGPIQLKLCSPVSERSLQIVANVEHCTPCGKYFIVGCRFLQASISTD